MKSRMREKRELALWMMPRRDQCWFIGRRMNRLHVNQAAFAWFALASRLEQLGEKDVPRYRDIIVTLRAIQLRARKLDPSLVCNKG